MEPIVNKIAEDNNILNFSLSGINVSIINGLRRIVYEIPVVVFRTSPHEADQSSFTVNTTRMNNELLKHRLSCIPIYADVDFPKDEYILRLDKQNNSSSIEYVTTADFEVIKVATKEKDAQMTAKLFPANPVTGDYPELARLLPRVSDNIEGERLAFTCKFDYGTAKENSAFNISSTCAYTNTLDPVKIKSAWAEKKAELSKTHSKEELIFAEKDWQLLESKRNFLPDSFEFIVETVGPIPNMAIMAKASTLMLEKLRKLIETIQSEPNVILVSETTIPNSFDIILKNEDYTLGKVIEFVLYTTHYDNTLHYCGFKKPHPHIDESLIRIGFKNPADKVTVVTYIVNAANEAIRIYEKILKVFEVNLNNYLYIYKVVWLNYN
jgi:DNA-directed RNA polymerase subunit L